MHDSNPRYEMQGLQHSPRRDSWIGTSQQRCSQHLYAYIQLIRFQSLPSQKTHVFCSTRQTIQLEGKWTETLNHEQFLLADDGDADQHIIIFATDQILHRLTASTIYMDGTFKACPKLLYQLFSIHIFIEGVQFPALYALLPGKSRDVYSRFFMLLLTKLQDLQLVLQPTRILTDFELAQVQSVQLAFPTSHIRVLLPLPTMHLEMGFHERSHCRISLRSTRACTTCVGLSTDEIWSTMY